MSQYDVSVIVPVYNAEKYLSQCIESILGQTKSNLELILVDDGSTDDSKGIIRGFAETHDNVVAVENSKKGVINARITGIKKARGSYIGWVDSDDFIDPSMFQKLYDLMIENDADLSYCDYDFYPQEVKEKGKWFKEYKGVKDWYLLERSTQCWNKLMSKKFIDDIQLIHLYEEVDEYANIALFLKTDKIVFTKEQLYHYRVGIQSISGGSYKGKTQRFSHFVDCASKLSEFLLDDNDTELKKYFEYRHIYSILQLMIVAVINGEKPVYHSSLKKLKSLKYKENPYTKTILDNNHGKKKSFVLRNLIPMGYPVAKIITNIVY